MGYMDPYDYGVLQQSAAGAARRLLGCELVRQFEEDEVRLRIVETEAYSPEDAASHSYRGRTPRNDVMFGKAGKLYVYFTYGMHHCANIVTGRDGEGSAVLIRGLEPLAGTEILRRYRPHVTDMQLTNGPAKLCQALDITRALTGHDLLEPPLSLIIKPAVKDEEVAETTRIGITRDTHRPWRFYLRGNPYVSRC